MKLHEPPRPSLVEEGLISLTDAARLLPRRRLRRPVVASTVYRYITAGYKGVRLEAVKTPGGLATSAPAVQRFLDAITASAVEDLADLEEQRRGGLLPTAAAGRASAELDRLGIGPKKRS